LGDAMVGVFLGWLVLIIGVDIRTYIGKGDAMVGWGAWRRFLAWALGDAMVGVFLGWLVLIIWVGIRTYIDIFERTYLYSKLQYLKSNLDRIWQIEYGDNIAIFDIKTLNFD
jgi:hypothetical protein